MKKKLVVIFIASLFFCTLNSYAQLSTYNWGNSSFSASSAQAKRYTIGRVYYNDAHWGSYGTIRFKVYSNYFKSAYLEYLVLGNPANSGNVPEITCVLAKGSISSSAKIELSSANSAGSQYAGGNNLYMDIYLDVDYYSQWYIEADIAAPAFAYDKSSIAYNEYSYVTLFTNPADQNISSFNTNTKTYKLPFEYGTLTIPMSTTINGSAELNNPTAASTSLWLKRGTQGYESGAPTGFGYPYLNIGGTEYNPNIYQTIGFGYTTSGSYHPAEMGYALRNQGGYTYGDIVFATRDNYSNVAPSEVVRITYDGKLGIGTNAPSEKLSVNGTASAKKFIVTQLGWSDYVFNEDYKLRSLTSLENFIKQKKHLPEIPTTKEVEEKGISVGDNQALLLKKMEELTLYIIEIKKENSELKKKIIHIENRIKKYK